MATPRALALGLMLAAIPQAPRTALGRCTFGREPIATRKLPEALTEVSGLAVGPGGTLLTHGDERGRVLVLDSSGTRVLRQVELEGVPRDDFEGIAAAGDSVALMTSTGRLYLFRLGATSPVHFSRFGTGVGRTCELEGLAWDRRNATLVLPCKNPVDRDAAGLTLFRYRLGPTPGAVAPVVVSAIALGRATGHDQIRPTSVEIDPVTGHYVVLSSKPALLLEVDSTGRVLVTTRLPAKQHPQAEGLTLTPDAIWIADEGDGRKGILTRYPCR